MCFEKKDEAIGQELGGMIFLYISFVYIQEAAGNIERKRTAQLSTYHSLYT